MSQHLLDSIHVSDNGSTRASENSQHQRWDDLMNRNDALWHRCWSEVAEKPQSVSPESDRAFEKPPPKPRVPPSKRAASTIALEFTPPELSAPAAPSTRKHHSKGKKQTSKPALASAKFIGSSGELHAAAGRNDARLIRELVEKGAAVNAPGRFGQTPLHLACRAGAFQAVKTLISLNADVSAADDDGSVPLHSAAMEGQCEIIALLLKHGAHIDCLHKKKHCTALALAISRCETAACHTLLTHKATVPRNALHLAAKKCDPEITELLLGNNVDASTRDRDDNTPLHCAAASNAVLVAQMLVRAGADVNARRNKDGWTPLHCAAHRKHLDMVGFLLKKGAHANAHTNDGRTSHEIALAKGASSLVELLERAVVGELPSSAHETFLSSRAAKRSVQHLAQSGAAMRETKQRTNEEQEDEDQVMENVEDEDETSEAEDERQPMEELVVSQNAKKKVERCKKCGAENSSVHTYCKHCRVSSSKDMNDEADLQFVPIVDLNGAPLRPYRIALVSEKVILAGARLAPYVAKLAQILAENGQGDHTDEIVSECSLYKSEESFCIVPEIEDLMKHAFPRHALVRDPSAGKQVGPNGFHRLLPHQLGNYLHDIVALLRLHGAPEETLQKLYQSRIAPVEIIIDSSDDG